MSAYLTPADNERLDALHEEAEALIDRARATADPQESLRLRREATARIRKAAAIRGYAEQKEAVGRG